ncbi:non-ribosomal peptide synthetase [Prauserella alba]|uniref:Carrier domain-containing protein n=1 Tax=Prauserella alba TaxID=176898 RepID=A0ABN1VM92_9PSEU|nr:non-ribosomal peptide synthetase [Prauserella alba]MCP2180813.1 amino acid adenylation domain-containing protein [Prauserella alba]
MSRQDEPPTVPALVARQVAATPDAVAVVDGAESVTYADLDARADRLAQLLADRGAGARGDAADVVGVCLPRGVDLVAALLAVWRVGGAYLPVDPAHPKGRIASLLTSAGARLVLTHADGVAPAGVPSVVPDDVPGVSGGHSGGPTQPAGIDPAYVLFTSGSTGTPKPVVVHHAGIANHARWRARVHGLRPGDRILQKTALTFDAAGWEIFAPLISGGTVVLAPDGAERDPAALVRTMAEKDITVLQVVPSLLRTLVSEQGWEECGSLRLLSSGGEQLHADLVQRFLGLVPHPDAVDVWNTYGPTECSIEVTAHRFDPAQWSGPVPIGLPIDGVRIELVDDAGHPVPAGRTGELVASGVGVGHGYHGRAGETAGRFVPDPAGPPGSRGYRTGDLVRTTQEGLLEYVGRIDHQLKVNGVRIEPGEIEAALTAHPAVDGAVVTGFTTADGDTRAAAHVQTAGGEVPADLREFLTARLPATHVPAVFGGLTAFPTTRSGKIDRSALPRIDVQPESPAGPLSGAERIVAEIWRDLLQTDDAGPDDDFFALGGSSLQLTRLANRIRKACGAAVDLSSLMNATTLAEQAAVVAEATGDPADDDRITRVSRDGPLPLSFGQRRMWVLDRMRPRSREWVSALFVRVAAGTGTQQVRRALNLLLERHEALRTRFVLHEGEPHQVIDPAGDYELRVVGDMPDATFTAELDRDLDRGFDIESGPVTRALLRRCGDHQVLVIAAHHIAIDGWSSTVLEQEFHELLDAVLTDRSPTLPPQELQYADFAVWQRATLDEKVIDKELAYWRAELDGAKPTTVRLDKPRPAARDGHGGIVGFTVPATVATTLDDLGKRAGATPFMTLLTAFATLLARYNSDWDVVVGTPVAGRNRPELENVVGFFLNSVVLRCRLDPDTDFTTALATVRDTCRDGFAHQDVPFDRLVAELAPERDLSRTPLYQVAFDLHDHKLTGSAGDPDDWATLLDASRIAKTDLTLYLRAEPDGTLAGGLEYATALFEPGTVERMTRHFLALLESIAQDTAGRALSEVDFLPSDERELLDTATYREAVPGGDPGTTLELFERQARATPDATALMCGTDRLTYAELDAKAGALAHRLQAMGAGPDTVVGVLLERGTNLLAAFLGVWKAGAAYLPLDVDAPAERTELVLADAGAPAVITTGEFRDRLTDDRPGVLLVDEIDPGEAGTGPERLTDPDLLAYVIYTSGSTGKPKGVQITHRGLANHLRWATAELTSRGSGGAAVFSSVAFDLVVPNLWAPLLAGQPVHLLPPDMDLTELGALLRERAPFSFLKLTPGHLEILSQQLDPSWIGDLADVIVVAGQELPVRLAEHWAATLGPGRLINEYGPSEATVGTCIHPVTAPVTGDNVPIGRPLPGVVMRVLDPLLRPAPVGVVGELYVGGTGLARCYAGAPALTAERFLPDPFSADGSRLYRTGDLAKVLPSGDVCFVGRNDDQVKIRGHRVEIGEVTAVLTAHASVREAVLLTDADGAGEVRLRAFAVPEASAGDGLAEQLLGDCARRLPSYMVPSSYTLVDRFPLTANGKLDRTRLVALTASGETSLRAPEGDVETGVAELFAELLGHHVGADSDFFAAGGNSILAIRLIAGIQETFDIELPIRVVFEDPTVAGLAAAVDTRIRAELDHAPGRGDVPAGDAVSERASGF